MKKSVVKPLAYNNTISDQNRKLASQHQLLSTAKSPLATKATVKKVFIKTEHLQQPVILQRPRKETKVAKAKPSKRAKAKDTTKENDPPVKRKAKQNRSPSLFSKENQLGEQSVEVSNALHAFGYLTKNYVDKNDCGDQTVSHLQQAIEQHKDQKEETMLLEPLGENAESHLHTLNFQRLENLVRMVEDSSLETEQETKNGDSLFLPLPDRQKSSNNLNVVAYTKN